MRPTRAIQAAVVATLASQGPSFVQAFPSLSSQDLAARANLAVGTWAAPGPNDIRGPCPGLNTLANHGFLPRDGRNIHSTDIVTAMNDQLGIASDFGLVQVVGAGVRGAITFLSDGGLGLKSFDVLTNSHNDIEHDASFTRGDLALGSNVIKNVTRIDKLMSFSTDGVVLTPDDLARARQDVFRASFLGNPSHKLEKKQTDACWREEALMVLVAGDEDGNIRLDWLKEWFANERLPTGLGWAPAKPAHGIIDNLKWTQKFKDLAQKLNVDDQLPLDFSGLPIRH